AIFERLASPDAVLRTALRAGWARRLVDPMSFSPSLGSKLRLAQLATWKWPDSSNEAPSLPKETVSVLNGAQFVGFIAKSGRSKLTSSERSRSGTPSRICGIGSETVLTWAVRGLTKIAA